MSDISRIALVGLPDKTHKVYVMEGVYEDMDCAKLLIKRFKSQKITAQIFGAYNFDHSKKMAIPPLYAVLSKTKGGWRFVNILTKKMYELNNKGEIINIRDW